MIGLLGTGRMGMPMCANLVRAGHEVIAHDLRTELQVQARAAGAQWAATAAEAAAAADVLITILPGPTEVGEAMVGAGGALRAMRRRTTWIDMSSNASVAAEPIRALAVERGVDVLDAPVGGGVAAAEEGTLAFFVGGSAEVLDRHRAVFDALGEPDRLVHVGGPGTGYTAKLLVNLLWFGQAIATAEALLLGQRAGIDLDVLRGALADSAASSRFLRSDLDALFAGDYMTSFGIDRCHEELANVTAQARAHGVPFELSNLVERIYRRALSRYGPVDGELLAVALLEEEAGTTLRTMSAVPVPAGPLPDSILLWDADELRDPPAAPCCLRSTRVGARAAVYRTGRGGAVAALVDFTADAEARSGGGWAAEGVVHLLGSPLPRSELLADDLLAPVFRHLRGRRGLPEPAARRLMSLLSPEA